VIVSSSPLLILPLKLCPRRPRQSSSTRMVGMSSVVGYRTLIVIQCTHSNGSGTASQGAQTSTPSAAATCTTCGDPHTTVLVVT
jgi:hypothetical protein